MKPGRIKLNIEQLILHNVSPGDRYRISDAIQNELSRLFAERGVPPALIKGKNAARIDAGELKIAPGAKPEAIGVQAARSIYGGFSK